MNIEPRNWRACFLGLVLRGGVTAVGLLFVALLTATAASAQSADLSVNSVAASANPVAAGGSITYTVAVINNGPNAATNVVVTDVPPPDTIPSIFFCAVGWSGTFVPGVRPVPTCSIASLPAGTTATHTFGMSVNADVPAGTDLFNTALITSATVDPFTPNNSVTITTTVNPGAAPAAVADLTVQKTGPIAGPIPAG